MLTPFILLFLIFLVTIIYRRNKHNETYWKDFMKIPGPKTYPIIGNLLETVADREKMFLNDRKRARTFFPIYKLWALQTAAVAIMSPEDMEIVLSDMRHIQKGRAYNLLHNWLRNGLLTSTGSYWQKRRKLLTPAFHFSILQEFVNIFNSETENLVEILAQKCNESVDVVKPITEFTLQSIGETSLGKKLQDLEGSDLYKKATYDFGEILAYRITRPWLHINILYALTSTSRKNKVVVNILHKFSTKVIKDRQKLYTSSEKSTASYSTRKRLALLDLLLKVKYDDSSIDDEGIREEVDTFMFEGHDTTSMGICYMLMALANEKTVQEEIVKEMKEVLGDAKISPSYNDLMELKYMERCIKECLRLYPSVPFISRTATEDIKTHSGHTIPKGCDILIYIYDLHHSPQVWDNPEKFDPDRFLPENVANRHPFAYVPFSAGPRNCIGQRFAILEMKAALCGILRKFELVPIDTPKTLKFKSDLVLRPLDEIKVKFVPRE